MKTAPSTPSRILDELQTISARVKASDYVGDVKKLATLIAELDTWILNEGTLPKRWKDALDHHDGFPWGRWS